MCLTEACFSIRNSAPSRQDRYKDFIDFLYRNTLSISEDADGHRTLTYSDKGSLTQLIELNATSMMTIRADGRRSVGNKPKPCILVSAIFPYGTEFLTSSYLAYPVTLLIAIVILESTNGNINVRSRRWYGTTYRKCTNATDAGNGGSEDVLDMTTVQSFGQGSIESLTNNAHAAGVIAEWCLLGRTHKKKSSLV